MVFEGGTVHGTNVTVSESTGAGILADVDELILNNVQVTDVAATDSGMFGRGIHVMDSDCSTSSAVRIAGLKIERTDDSGLFIQRINNAHVTNASIHDVGMADVPDAMGGGAASDGIVITSRDPSTAAELTSSYTFMTVLDESLGVHGATRASILVDGGELRISPDTTLEGMLTESGSTLTYTQNSATLSSPIPFAYLGEGDSPYFPYGIGPMCLNLDKPSATTPSISAALNCLPFEDDDGSPDPDDVDVPD